MEPTRPPVIGAFDEPAMADQAVQALNDAGFANDQITHSAHAARHGGFLSGLKSLFTGGDDESKGIAHALMSMGVSEEEASYYANEHHAGHPVIAVRAAGREQEAETILRTAGAYNADTGSPSDSTRGTAAASTAAGYSQPGGYNDQSRMPRNDADVGGNGPAYTEQNVMNRSADTRSEDVHNAIRPDSAPVQSSYTAPANQKPARSTPRTDPAAAAYDPRSANTSRPVDPDFINQPAGGTRMDADTTRSASFPGAPTPDTRNVPYSGSTPDQPGYTNQTGQVAGNNPPNTVNQPGQPVRGNPPNTVNQPAQTVSGGPLNTNPNRTDPNAPVTHDEAVIQRGPTPGNPNASTTPTGQDDVVRIPISQQPVNVTNEPVTTGEVPVGQRATSENQAINDPTRRENARLEPGSDAPPTTDQTSNPQNPIDSIRNAIDNVRDKTVDRNQNRPAPDQGQGM